MNIIALDDDFDFLNILTRTMKDLDYKFKPTSNMLEFTNALKNDQYDLIIMDLYLRDRFLGLNLIQFIKDHQKFKEIPILATSRFNDQQKINEVLSFGADDYLIKPIDTYTISNKINFLTSDFGATEQYLTKVPSDFQDIKIKTKVTLKHLGIEHIILQSELYIYPGTKLEIEVSGLSQYYDSKDLIQIIVLGCQKLHNTSWEIKCVPTKDSKELLKKLFKPGLR